MKPTHLILPLLFLLLGQRSPAQPPLDSLFQAGLTAMQQFRYNEAHSLFYECHRSAPENQAYLEKLGQCYFQMGNLQEGRFFLKEVIKNDSLHVPTLNLLATIEEQLLDYRSALGRAERLIRVDSTNGYYRRLAGKLCENLNLADAASLHYHHALRLNPSDQVAVIAYCKLLSETGHLAFADSLMDAALRKQGKNLRLLYESAKLKYANRQFREVLPRFEVALSLGDTNLTFLPLLAFSLSQMDSCGAAMPWLRHLLKHSTKPNEQLHYFLGRCYQALDSLPQSFTQYELAILAAQSPNIGFYYQLMGDVTAQQKRHKQSLKYYELAQENGNSDPVIYFHQATALDLLNTKDKHKAIEQYKKFLKNEDGKKPDLRQYAKKRVEELEYYEKHIWKG